MSTKTFLLLATAMIQANRGDFKKAARAVLAASKTPDAAAVIASISEQATREARKVKAARQRVSASEDFLFTQHDLLGEEGPSQMQRQHEDTREVQTGGDMDDLSDEFAAFDEEEVYDASASKVKASTTSLMKVSKALAKKKVKAEDEEGDDEETAADEDDEAEEKAKSKAKAKAKKVKAAEEEDEDDGGKEEAAFRGRLQRASRLLGRR